VAPKKPFGWENGRKRSQIINVDNFSSFYFLFILWPEYIRKTSKLHKHATFLSVFAEISLGQGPETKILRKKFNSGEIFEVLNFSVDSP
jgi:hypothetical protein